jgi:hypothetical protein
VGLPKAVGYDVGMDTPLGADARLGNAPEDPAAFLLMMIGTLYARPQMYVRRLGELNSLLYFTHFLWANIARERTNYIRFGGWSFHELTGYYELQELLESDTTFYSDAKDFAAVVSFWQAVDAHIGINPVE